MWSTDRIRKRDLCSTAICHKHGESLLIGIWLQAVHVYCSHYYAFVISLVQLAFGADSDIVL